MVEGEGAGCVLTVGSGAVGGGREAKIEEATSFARRGFGSDRKQFKRFSEGGRCTAIRGQDCVVGLGIPQLSRLDLYQQICLGPTHHGLPWPVSGVTRTISPASTLRSACISRSRLVGRAQRGLRRYLPKSVEKDPKGSKLSPYGPDRGNRGVGVCHIVEEGC